MSEITQLCDRMMERHGKTELPDRLTTKLQGGIDPFGMPLVTTYDVDLGSAQGRIKARCRLGAYEDTGLSPKDIATIKAALPALVAEVRRLDAEVIRYRTLAADVWGGIQTAQTKRNGDVYFTATTAKETLDALNQNMTERREWMPEFKEQEAADGQV